MIKISVINRSVRLVCDNDPITTGSVGYPVSFSFSDEWGGLAKTAVFYGSGVRRDVALINSTETTIPHEVLHEAGTMLRIGVYGALPDGTIVMPTVIVDVSRIKQGAKPSEIDPEAPTPSWVAEVQNAATDALEKAEAVEDAAERGEFDGVSPEVTFTDITNGHRMTVTDKTHPSGQSIDILNGSAGTTFWFGTRAEYNALPSIDPAVCYCIEEGT